jgi:hypothetical protein
MRQVAKIVGIIRLACGVILGGWAIVLGTLIGIGWPMEGTLVASHGVLFSHKWVIGGEIELDDSIDLLPRWPFRGLIEVSATHPPTLTTLVLAALLCVRTGGRTVVVMREGLPWLVTWLMWWTGAGIFIRRGAHSSERFTDDLRRAIERFQGNLLVLSFPDAHRPDEGRIDASYQAVHSKFPELYDEFGVSGWQRRTALPRTGVISEMRMAAEGYAASSLFLTIGHRHASVHVPLTELASPVVIRVQDAPGLITCDPHEKEIMRGLLKLWQGADADLAAWASGAKKV